MHLSGISATALPAAPVSGGLHGVGVSAVNALSDWLELEIRRGGKVSSPLLRYASGMFLAVGKGSDQEPRFIHMVYKPAKKPKARS